MAVFTESQIAKRLSSDSFTPGFVPYMVFRTFGTGPVEFDSGYYRNGDAYLRNVTREIRYADLQDKIIIPDPPTVIYGLGFVVKGKTILTKISDNEWSEEYIEFRK